MTLIKALEHNAITTLALIEEFRRLENKPNIPVTDVVVPKTKSVVKAPIKSVPIISNLVPSTNDCPGIKLDMKKATPASKLVDLSFDNSGEHVPRGYVLAEVDSPGTGQFEGMILTEHGGATLLADSNGLAKYVLGCGHVPTYVDPNTGEFSSIASEYRLSIRPDSRSNQKLVFTCDEVYTHPWYEGDAGTYRWDLSLSVLPEPVNIAHAISRYDMSLHRVDPGEELMYCGFGSKEKHGPLHENIHFGRMRATNKSRDHITEMLPIDDQFEQGFSGGPFYSESQQMAWSGVTSHYVELGDDKRKSYIIPASVALPWADAMITWHMNQ